MAGKYNRRAGLVALALVASITFGVIASTVHAQRGITTPHPASSTQARALATAVQHGGFSLGAGAPSAGLWSGMHNLAPALVTEYAVGRYVGYTQTSDAAPVTPEVWTLIGVIVTDSPDAIVSAQLSFDVPPPVSYPMAVSNAYILNYLGTYFTDEPSFLLAYPATTYTMTADLGAGLVTGDLILPADLYCPEIPAFTGNTFVRMQDYNTLLTFDGTINGFTLAPGTNAGSSTVTLVEVGQPGTVWSADLQPGDTAFQIPAGLLLPGTDYSIGISYFNVASTPNGGFGTATSEAQFFRSTGAIFKTRPLDIVAVPGGGPGARFTLLPAWPNPMGLASTLRFSLPGKHHVRAVVLNLAGREVARLADSDYEAGEHTLRWTGTGEGGTKAPSGTYFVRIEAAGQVRTTRVTLLR